MAEKKRKNATTHEERPSKKPQTTSIRLKHTASSTNAKPVIASSSGVVLPSNLKFQSYIKKDRSNVSDLLIHTSEHPTIDYSASEADNTAGKFLKHYVAIHDPATGELQVLEAKSLNVKSSVRTISSPEEEAGEEPSMPVTNYSSRAALTAAFGTKKSKKAVQSIAENRLLAQGNESDDNPVTTALLSGATDKDPTTIQLAEDLARANKPLPQANTATNEIAEVYSHTTLIHPSPYTSTLQLIPTGPWTARIAAKKEILTRSRFVANRVGYLIKRLLSSPDASDPRTLLAIQLLRYTQLLVEIHNYIRTLRRRPIPPSDKWPTDAVSDDTPFMLIDPIVAHFFPSSAGMEGKHTPSENGLTLLRTTILALTLHIPPPSFNAGLNTLVTEPTDISMDMAIDANDIRRLYRELGCKIEPATEAELSLWGLERNYGKNSNGSKGKVKDESGGVQASRSKASQKPRFAKLSFPIEFPKVSRGRQQGKR